ncbi:hypothetical protein FQN54_002879 [Arachnomyces sp. PD_36]|nr:hypothetical protein FQN54_002879 [Arachnomyces sp. PD_36]
MASKFPNAGPSIQELAQETDQEPPPQDGTLDEFIDASLPILIKANEYYQELQDAGIRKEFIRHHNDTEKQLSAQRSDMEKEFSAVEKGFDDVERRFKGYDGKLSVMRGHQSTYTRWIDLFQQRIAEQRRYINDKLSVVDSKVERLDGKIERLNADFRHLKGKLSNSKAERGFHQVEPVWVYDDAGGCSVPEGLPKTVRDFWRLKRLSQRPQLVSLVKAYNVTPAEILQPEGDESSDELDNDADNLPQPLTPEAVVGLYPERAHQIIAHRLGLDYHKISIFMQEPRKKKLVTANSNGNETADDSEYGEEADKKDKFPSTSQIIVPVPSGSKTDGSPKQEPSTTSDEKIVLTLNSI